MNLQRLLAEYRKISRRLKRRALLASARQVQAWKRRLTYLEERIRLAGGRGMRRVALASALVAAGSSSVAVAAPGPSNPNAPFKDLGVVSPLFPVYGRYAQPVFGDLDADGDLDCLLVSSGSYGPYGYIFQWKNVGSKNTPRFEFQYPHSSSTANIFYDGTYKGGTLVDVDHDGDLDLVLGGYDFFRNEGTPQVPDFQQKYGSENPLYTAYAYSSAAVGDFDGDGDVDLIASGSGYPYSGDLQYFRNDGTTMVELTGGDSPIQGIDITGGFFPWWTVGDVDGDGDKDVILSSYPSSYGFQLLRNIGNERSPKFSDEGILPGLNPGYFGVPALADLDGDGDLDLVSPIQRDSASYYLGPDKSVDVFWNKGTARTAGFSQPLDAAGIYWNNSSYDDYDYPYLAADVDGDGDLDILQENLWLRNDNGHFSFVHPNDNPFKKFGTDYSGNGRTFVDLDGDGRNEQILTYGSSFYYYKVSGSGNSLSVDQQSGAADPFSSLSLPGSAYYHRSIVGDIDGDGDMDLAFARIDDYYGWTFFRNDGTRTAPSFTRFNDGDPENPFSYLNSYYVSPLLLDLDRDGDLDLLQVPTYSGYNRVTYYRNTGTKTAPSFTTVNGGDTENPFYGVNLPNNNALFIDWDSDGDTDVLLRDQNDLVFKIYINTYGRFTQVDPVAVDRAKIIVGPVPAKAGEDICIFVDKPTDSVDLNLYNLAGERVISGLNMASVGNTCFKANIAPGLYWARIKSGDRTFMQKIIITAK